MKLFVVLSVACAVLAVAQAGMSPEQRKELEDRLIKECGTKEGVTDADIAEVLERKLPSTRNGKCMHACIVESVGIVKDNVVHMDTVVEMAKMLLQDDKKVAVAQEIAGECSGTSDTDRCELAYKLMQCGMQASEKRGINFREYI